MRRSCWRSFTWWSASSPCRFARRRRPGRQVHQTARRQPAAKSADRAPNGGRGQCTGRGAGRADADHPGRHRSDGSRTHPRARPEPVGNGHHMHGAEHAGDRPETGWLEWGYDAIVRSHDYPLAAGQRIKLEGLTVDVRSLTPDDRPAEAAFTFDVPLDDPSLLRAGAGGCAFVPFTPPRWARPPTSPQQLRRSETQSEPRTPVRGGGAERLGLGRRPGTRAVFPPAAGSRDCDRHHPAPVGSTEQSPLRHCRG